MISWVLRLYKLGLYHDKLVLILRIITYKLGLNILKLALNILKWGLYHDKLGL